MATTNNSRFGEQAGTVELLWGPRPQPTRGPKPALSIDRIAQAAIAVADAEGLAAVSMQRVAAELGVTKMALYRYVPGKADLIALMVDAAGDPPPVLDSEADGWRAQLGHWARRLLAVFQRHPLFWLTSKKPVPSLSPVLKSSRGMIPSSAAPFCTARSTSQVSRWRTTFHSPPAPWNADLPPW